VSPAAVTHLEDLIEVTEKKQFIETSEGGTKAAFWSHE
jgi:hypothetical protein